MAKQRGEMYNKIDWAKIGFAFGMGLYTAEQIIYLISETLRAITGLPLG